MPREPERHQISTLALPGGDLVEYDHDNGWMALLTVRNQRLNFRPVSVRHLSHFFQGVFEQQHAQVTRLLSEEYWVIWKEHTMLLQIRETQEITFAAAAARAWYEFLTAIFAAEEG